MLFSQHHTSGVRVLSHAYADAREFVQTILPRKLNDHEETLLSRRITRNLMDAHDSGEREPGALRRAALMGVLASGIWS